MNESTKIASPSATTRAGMASDELKVKGSSINSKLAFARERFGEDAEKALDAYLSERGISQVLEGSWYLFDVFDGLLCHLAKLHYGGDLSRLQEVGEYSAEKSLTGTYSIYTLWDFARFLERIASLHRRFYSIGEIEPRIAEDGQSCRIHMHGAPSYSEADLYVAQGFYIGAARVMGHESVYCQFEITHGEVVFELDWGS